MAKKVQAIVKLQIPAGKATPAPPVGPALGQHGVNIMEFCKTYNERTASMVGTIVPVEINRAQVVSSFAKLPRQVVMAVNEGNLLKDFPDFHNPLGVGVGGCCGRICGGGQHSHEQDCGKMTNDE